MSLDKYLLQLSSSLVLSDKEAKETHNAISMVESSVGTWFGTEIVSHFNFGSFARDTSLPQHVDKRASVDYMVVFQRISDEYEPKAYLHRIKSFVASEYSECETKIKESSIIIKIDDIYIRLMPATNLDESYVIPSPLVFRRDFVLTNPKRSKSLLERRDRSCDYKIKPLIRLIKYWNSQNRYHFNPYWIENYILSKSYFFCSSMIDYVNEFWSVGLIKPPYVGRQTRKDIRGL